MNLTIHRGTNQIGGTCIELQTANTRILIGFGMPLIFEDF
jgi:ribonuclease J